LTFTGSDRQAEKEQAVFTFGYVLEPGADFRYLWGQGLLTPYYPGIVLSLCPAKDREEDSFKDFLGEAGGIN